MCGIHVKTVVAGVRIIVVVAMAMGMGLVSTPWWFGVRIIVVVAGWLAMGGWLVST